MTQLGIIRQQVSQKLRNQSLMRWESALSYPVPLVFAGKVTYRFFVYLSLAQPQKKLSLIYYPTQGVDLDPQTWEVTKIRNYQKQPNSKPIGTHTITDAQLAELKMDMPTLIDRFEILYQSAMDQYIQSETTDVPFSYSDEDKN